MKITCRCGASFEFVNKNLIGFNSTVDKFLGIHKECCSVSKGNITTDIPKERRSITLNVDEVILNVRDGMGRTFLMGLNTPANAGMIAHGIVKYLTWRYENKLSLKVNK